MRLPFISRASHEEIVESTRSCIAVEHDRALHAEALLADLQQKYHDLRVSGANPVPTKPQVDEVAQAVNMACRGDPMLRNQMMRQVAQDKLDGFTEQEIVRRIQSGAGESTLEEFLA